MTYPEPARLTVASHERGLGKNNAMADWVFLNSKSRNRSDF